jgi:amidophosphoribosyltransferase
MEDKFHDECGVVGVFGHPEAANLAYLGLYALQHRGQESAGIVSSDESKVYVELGTGLVADVFNEERLLQLPGEIAIGHNRYSTTGENHLKNAQPCLIEYRGGPLALAHNGNLVNADSIRHSLESSGSIFQSTNDSEVILHLIAKSQNAVFIDNVIEALSQVKGAYSILLLTKDKVVAARDPKGFRPLCLGRLDGAYILASESCVLDLVNAEYIREINPGEIVQIDKSGLQTFSPFGEQPKKSCVFEHIYFARPDSLVFGEDVYQTRKAMGKALAEEWPVEADIVMPVPDSGNISALGYSEKLDIPFEMGLIRNHYVGRTFIEPQSQIRDFGVRVKLNAVKNIVKGKRVVVIDDSIVRGTTSRKIVKMIRDAGAKEVHVRISSPPSLHPCFYGIDTPTKQELIASTKTVEETGEYIMADSLHYISLDKMMSIFKNTQNNYCKACFDGDYPIPKEHFEPNFNQLDLFSKK